ncbi:extracellular solute-binding protein [Micrococcales bacterium 31B]|nr:extracellular solute-binding protein [Micrococcales bacterium 31B]
MISTTRRQAFGLALGVAAGLSLGACGRGESDTGGVQLRLAWWGNNERTKLMNAVIAGFESANPGVTVKGEPGDIDGYFDRLATTVAAKRAPDVFTLGGAYPSEYAGRGALLDLNTVKADLDLTHIDSTGLASGAIDGVQYGVINSTNAIAVIANPAVVAAAGLEMPDDTTWTWDDFISLGTEITKSSPSGTYGVQATLDHNNTDLIARQHGERLFTESGGLGISSDVLTTYFEIAEKLSSSGAMPEPGLAQEQLGVSLEQSLMAQGKAAFWITWSNSLDALAAAAKTDLRLLRVPGDTPRTGMWLQPSQFYCISAQTEHPRESARLLDYLVNNVEAGAILGMNRGVPANATIRDAIAPDLSAASIQQLEYIDLIAKLDMPPTYLGPAGASQIEDITARALSDLSFGRLSVAQATSQWLRESQAAIA